MTILVFLRFHGEGAVKILDGTDDKREVESYVVRRSAADTATDRLRAFDGHHVVTNRVRNASSGSHASGTVQLWWISPANTSIQWIF
jgi:hypothetical protein